MVKNIQTSLFKQETEDLALKSNNNKEEETDIDETLDSIIDNILNTFENFSIANATIFMATLYRMIRKK